MFGFGKSARQKRELEALDRKHKNIDTMLKNARERVEKDPTLYKWQKQKQLKQLQKMECEQIVKYADKKKQIKEK